MVTVRTAALVLAFLACASSGRRLQHWSTQTDVLSNDENDDSQKALRRLLQAISPTSGYQMSGAGQGIGLSVSNPSASTLKVQASPYSLARVRAAVIDDPDSIPERIYNEKDAWKRPGIEIVYQSEEDRANIQEGLHKHQGRLFPCHTNGLDSAIILSVAGAYPGIRAEQVKAPIVLPHSPPGKFAFHLLSAEASPGGIVTLIDEGGRISKFHPDAVVIVCQRSSLGIGGIEDEVLAIVDRSDVAVRDSSYFSTKEFYAFADAEGLVHIRWFEEIPEGWSIVGRVVSVQLPHYPESRVSPAFAEMDDGFEF